MGPPPRKGFPDWTLTMAPSHGQRREATGQALHLPGPPVAGASHSMVARGVSQEGLQGWFPKDPQKPLT